MTWNGLRACETAHPDMDLASPNIFDALWHYDGRNCELSCLRRIASGMKVESPGADFDQRNYQAGNTDHSIRI